MGLVALVSALAGETMTASPQARLARSEPLGWSRPISTVTSSIAVTSLMPLKRCFWALVESVGHGAVEGEDHVLGGEGGAVVEGDAGAQVEHPGEAVGGDLPALGQGRLDRAVVGEAGEALEDVGVDHLVDGCGGAGGRVEDRRLELHADDDVGALGRGRGGHQHQTRGKRQKSLHLRPSTRRGFATGAIFVALRCEIQSGVGLGADMCASA